MKDQEIYAAIGQTLYDEVGYIDDCISLSACAVADQNSVDTSVWKGEYLDAFSSVRLSNKASLEIHMLVVQLKKYFEMESMGIWNLEFGI
ncbi:hypothetical protein [Teredinibacter turnerae]|uniref:hypothetical protein n=1 Tax=Teredinibacter turnerae TaxID=2426 RepID=UPI000410D629|nr:hypothetical protein [Teredinibacter turnerae]